MSSFHSVLCHGNAAAALALRHAKPGVLALYPITPSTAAAEAVALDVQQGLLDAELVLVEGENSALAACVGASSAGIRTATITSSQGLLYMAQILLIASGMRLPLVILNATRAVSAPLNVNGDHSDAMATRAMGCIQLFARNAQEVYDLTLMAFRIAEEALLPVMVCYDGFSVSHTMTTVEPLFPEVASQFVGEYLPECSLLNTSVPRTYGPVCGPAYYTQAKYAQRKAMRSALEIYAKVKVEYAALSGRSVPGFFESYLAEDAEDIVVLIGSTTGTMRETIDELRCHDRKVGMLSLLCYRPFPEDIVRAVLQRAARVIVLDRSEEYGTPGGPLFTDVCAALYRLPHARPDVYGFVYGLGGKELLPSTAHDIFTLVDISEPFDLMYLQEGE